MLKDKLEKDAKRGQISILSNKEGVRGGQM